VFVGLPSGEDRARVDAVGAGRFAVSTVSTDVPMPSSTVNLRFAFAF